MPKNLRDFFNETQSDHSQLSQEEHEIIYNLIHNFECRSTKANQDILAQILYEFKQSKGSQYTKDYNRPEFYEYARKHRLFKNLEMKQNR